MILFDTHLHTEYSTDSDTSPAEQIKRAEQLGLRGICITDHIDHDFPREALETPIEGTPFFFDTDGYKKRLKREREKTTLELLIGVECGLQPEEETIRKNERLVSERDWDYIIGSLHLVNKKDIYYPSFWADREPSSCIREYFTQLLENIRAFPFFDALGHMDYVVRYAPASYQYEPERFMEQIDAILEFLIKKDIALEINTSGWKTEGRCQNPHWDIVKRYLSLGGELVTIGSDAHAPDFLAYRFSVLPELLKKAGLRQYCVYKERKPVFHDL